MVKSVMAFPFYKLQPVSVSEAMVAVLGVSPKEAWAGLPSYELNLN